MNKLPTHLAKATLFGVFAVSFAAPAVEASTTLRVAHVWPGGSMIDRELFQAWAESVEEASDGQLTVEVFPSQTLAKSAQTYESAVSGIADIGASAQGYTAGRFPLTSSCRGSHQAPAKEPAYSSRFTIRDTLNRSTPTRALCSCSLPAQVICIPRIN